MGPYLATLCTALAQSMIGDNRSISIKFNGKGGNCKRRDAESIGLIVTELVINSLKHAFDETTKDGEIKVSYDVSGPIGSFGSLTTAPANLTACSLNQKPDSVPVSLKRCQSSLMLKW
jgi:two-component sensor histidine kinase